MSLQRMQRKVKNVLGCELRSQNQNPIHQKERKGGEQLMECEIARSKNTYKRVPSKKRACFAFNGRV